MPVEIIPSCWYCCCFCRKLIEHKTYTQVDIGDVVVVVVVVGAVVADFVVVPDFLNNISSKLWYFRMCLLQFFCSLNVAGQKRHCT